MDTNSIGNGRLSAEDADLLVKDLCARLPYGVVCRMGGEGRATVVGKLTPIGLFQFMEEGMGCVPYLRPMDRKTAAETKELNNVLYFQYYSDDSCMCESNDWLSQHHFDYRGLIGKGLALEAPEDMYGPDGFGEDLVGDDDIVSYEHTEYVVEYWWSEAVFENTDRFSSFDEAVLRMKEIRQKGGFLKAFYRTHKTAYDISGILLGEGIREP